MAKHTHTTRRVVMSACATLTALIVTPVREAPLPPGEQRRRNAREFIEQFAWSHPRGRMVATRAMAMGLDPLHISLIRWHDVSLPHTMPSIEFRPPNPNGIRVVVNAVGSFECGPEVEDWMRQWL